MRLKTPLSCDLEPYITNPTSRNIVVSNDMYPDLSAGLDSGKVIARVFREPFLFHSSCQYFGKADEGRKMRNQLWIRMGGYLNYTSSR